MDAGSLWGGQDMPYGRAEGEEPEACVAFSMLFVGCVFQVCVCVCVCVCVSCKMCVGDAV